MLIITKNNKKGFFLYFSFIGIFLSSLLLYLPSLKFYFFQDDWFVLNWVKTGDFLSFLALRKDIIYWRPLSMPLFFDTLYNVFGLNYVAYHVVAFLIFTSLLVLIYKLLHKLLNDFKIALASTFFYAIWPINYISMSWLSTTSYIIVPLFMAASFISFLNYSASFNKKYLIFTYLLFVGALMSHETAVVLPLIFVFWTLIFKKKNLLASSVPMVIISAAYLFLRFFVFSLPAKGPYQLQIGKSVLYNYIWYWLWAFNFPESFKSLVDPRIVGQSILVLKQFWWISLSCFALIILFILMLRQGLKSDFKNYLFGFSWFTIMLLPVMFVPGHTFPMYLSFAGLGLLYMIGTSIKRVAHVLTLVLIIFWTISAIANFQFTRATHWVENEQSISRNYVEFTKSTIKNPPANSIFVFLPTYKNLQRNGDLELAKDLDTLKLSLSDQNALQVIYQDTTLKSLYQRDELFAEETTSKVYYISPK